MTLKIHPVNIYIIAIKIHIGFIQFPSLLLAKDPESFTGIFQKTFQQNLTAGNKNGLFTCQGQIRTPHWESRL